MVSFLPIPNEICGVKIPSISVDDLTDVVKLKQKASEVAINAGAQITGLDGILDASKDVQIVLSNGAKTVKKSCEVLTAGSKSIAAIQIAMAPLMPLFNASADPSAAFSKLSKGNLNACVAIIEHVLSLGNLLETIGKLLHVVREAFEQLLTSAQHIIGKVKEVLEEVAEQFRISLQLKKSLSGIEGFFEENTALVKNLADMNDTLGPILKACDSQDFASVAIFGAQRWDDVLNAFQNFMPAWENTQGLYNQSRAFGVTSLEKITAAWDSFTCMIKEVCDTLSVSIPEWLSADANPLAGVVAPPAVEVKAASAKKEGGIEAYVETFVPAEKRGRCKLCCALMTVVGGRARVRQMQADCEEQQTLA